MTNQELLEIIKLANKKKIKEETLKKLFSLVEQDGGIKTSTVKRLKSLFLSSKISTHQIEDPQLFIILEEVKRTKEFIWYLEQEELIAYLEELIAHPLIKEVLINENYHAMELQSILNTISVLKNKDDEKLYLEKLSQLPKNEFQELKFLNLIFKEVLLHEQSVLFKLEPFFTYLMNPNIPLNFRHTILSLWLNIRFSKEMGKTLKEKRLATIIQAYDQYGPEFTQSYISALNTGIDLDLPELSYLEIELYINLYNKLSFLCSLKKNIAQNFICSFYYLILVNKELPPEQRIEIARLITEPQIILKDKLVKILVKSYLTKGKEHMLCLKYAFLNHGIRTNPLAMQILEAEEDVEVLLPTVQILKLNDVRKDNRSLSKLIKLTEKEEKLEFLHELEKTYAHKKNEPKPQNKEPLNEYYEAFLEGKRNLEELKKILEENKRQNVLLVRTKEKEDR